MENKTKKPAGRKPIEDKKQKVILYIRQSKINEKGGEENIKEFLYSMIK